ncbi:MAG: hypothetical protein AAGF24_11465 [Cyanobacteria bacterium P01_H01_bin.121]
MTFTAKSLAAAVTRGSSLSSVHVTVIGISGDRALIRWPQQCKGRYAERRVIPAAVRLYKLSDVQQYGGGLFTVVWTQDQQRLTPSLKRTLSEQYL